MKNTVFNWFRGFRDDEEGSIAVETVLIIPALFWAYLAMFATFDAHRHLSINQKAAFTIGDMVSRETNPIDQAYLNGARELLGYLTANQNRLENVSIRVSTLKYNADADIYERDWSETSGTMVSPLEAGSTNQWHDRLPVLPANERITVVETFVKYDPPFNTGLSTRMIENFVFTKPRYAPQVLFSDGSSS